MSDSAESRADDVKTVKEVLNFKGSDETKFDLLSVLIQGKKASPNDVIGGVSNLLVGGEFGKNNFVIQDSRNILHMLKFISFCPCSLQVDVWNAFLTILKKSQRNLHACTEVGLIAHALPLLNDADEAIADKLTELLSILASYSITIKELKAVFAILEAKNSVWHHHSARLISVLHHMTQRQGPDEFFTFPGKKGSHIALPPLKTWPHQNGWTFICWARFDPTSGSSEERRKPFLYCFRTSKGIGYSAHFSGGSLVITAMKMRGKGFQHSVSYDFQPRQWYMISLVYVLNRWSKSEIRCYVDGQLVSSGDMSWQVSTSDPFDKCYIGSSVDGDPEEMFCGQISAVFVFSEVLSLPQICEIYYLGPGYMIFNNTKLSSSIAFMYSPEACDGQLCLESSPKGSQSYFLHSPHAMLCQDVKAVVKVSVYSSLHSLGGVEILFPLFRQLDMPVDNDPGKSMEIDYTICAGLIDFIGDLVLHSPSARQQMFQSNGFLVISHFLEESSKQHISPPVVETFLKLIELLVGVQNGEKLVGHILDSILLNPQLWVHTSVEVQTKLYCYFATEFVSNPRIYNCIKRVNAVLNIMQALKYYYWVVNPLDSSGVQPKVDDGPRPTKDEILKMRSFMLMFVKELILKGKMILEDELQSILSYLSTLNEDENVIDVFELLVQLMAQIPASMVPAFDKKNGIRIVFKLLASKNKVIQMMALHLLGFFLMRSTFKRRQDVMTPYNLFSLLGDRLMLNIDSITMPYYKALFEILTARVNFDKDEKRKNDQKNTFRFENPAILKVIATMILQSKPTSEVMEIKKTFLSDLMILCDNKDNRRTLLQLSVWQDWLFSLSYIYPRSSEQQLIADTVIGLFKVLLHHAIKSEFGGWRVWMDTLAILHCKVAREDFKIHMAIKYKQFQQQRVDNISDLSDLQQQPVSTISGLSDGKDRQHSFRSSVKISEVSDREHPQVTMRNERKEEDKAEITENEHKKDENKKAGKPDDDAGDKKLKEFPEDSNNVKTAETNHKKENNNDDHSDDYTEETKTAEAPENVTNKREDRNNEGEESGQAAENKTKEKTPQEDGRSIEKCASSTEDKEISQEKSGNTPSSSESHGASSLESKKGHASEGKESKSKQQVFKKAHSMSSHEAKNVSSHAGGHTFSPDHRAPTFHIPEFSWSFLHQKLLSDLLFSMEADIQEWKSQSTKDVAEFVNSSENHIFVVNSIHVVSQLCDCLVIACGGLLPLLAAATSQKEEPILQQPYQGLDLEQAVMILKRVMYLTDILVFSSITNLAELESDKNMPSGGILRQSLRLVCTTAVKNCLERRLNVQEDDSAEYPSVVTSKPLNDLDPKQGSLDISNLPNKQNSQDNLMVQADFERLLQDADIQRLKSVVYRDMAEARQAQYLALAVVYFCSVMMVSKYRDILEPPIRASVSPTSNNNKTSTDADLTKKSKSNEGASEASEIKESQIHQDQQSQIDQKNQQHQTGKLKEEINEKDKAEKNEEEPVSETNKLQPASGDSGLASASSVRDNEADGLSDGETETSEEDIKYVNSDNGKNHSRSETLNETGHDESDMVDVDLKDDSESFKPPQVTKVTEKKPEAVDGQESGESLKTISSISVSHNPAANQAVGDSKLTSNDLELSISPPVYSVAMARAYCENLTEKLEKTLGSLAPLLREVFVDFAPSLSKTLTGSHGQELLIGGGGLTTMKNSTSVVELVMLLCSQEWQSSLQKHAGIAFVELVNEGRLLAHSTRDHIVRVANEAEFILNRLRAEDVQKHADFESVCAQTVLEWKEEDKLSDNLILSGRKHDHSVAVKQSDKILGILSSKCWVQPSDQDQLDNECLKLDMWEDDSRRRKRMIKDPMGSTQAETTTRIGNEQDAAEDEMDDVEDFADLANEDFYGYLTSLRKSQRDKAYFTDEELMIEEDVEQEFSGAVALCTPCKLIAPGAEVKGIMTITKNELYFEMDEDDPDNRKIDSKILAYVDFRYSKWEFQEIRAIFARRYLMQNVAIEIFLASRRAVMFAFPDQLTTVKVINALPRVGIGIKYGMQQRRRFSLATGKQLFKLSIMTQKWQKREISNFDYIMYLNTIAGRTYNDLKQYPVFPWVLVNYDTDTLDLNSPSSYRDFSKPVGALNETRKAFFEERFNSWRHDQIPPFHYGTHYSTTASTLNWLGRVEPFKTILHKACTNQDKKAFTSVGHAWRNCQQDTSDVREVVPELFYFPEMFKNGEISSSSSEDSNDAELPPWAKSHEEFVRINSIALESEFVSSQIHNWIDLIFGYRQKGPEAVRATNVFYYLAYDGNLDLEDVTDPVMKEKIEKHIQSFGQIPSQLLTEPHQPRNTVMHMSPMIFPKYQDDVCMMLKFLSNSPVVYITANTQPSVAVPSVTSISGNHMYAINKWNNNYIWKPDPTGQNNVPLTIDQLLASNPGNQRRSLGGSFDQRLPVNHNNFVITADNLILFACGFWDKSFRLFQLETARTIQVVFGHFDIVTCITRSESRVNQDCYVITGSKDCTVMVWTFSAKVQAIVGEHNSVPTPKSILIGHESEITCIAASAELGLVVSGSQGGLCLIHTLTGVLLNVFEPPVNCRSPRLIVVSREAFVILVYGTGNVCMFSINGKILNYIEHTDNLQSMILSRDSQFMLVGGNEGVVEIRQVHDFRCLHSFSSVDNPVRSLALTHDQRFLIAGLATGCLVVFNIDFNKWRPDSHESYS